jgi:hypothetical protein
MITVWTWVSQDKPIKVSLGNSSETMDVQEARATIARLETAIARVTQHGGTWQRV